MTPGAYRYVSSAAYAVAMASIALTPSVGVVVTGFVAGLALVVVVAIPLASREIRDGYASPALHAGDGLLLPFAVAIAAAFIARSDPGIWNLGLGALTLVVSWFMGLSFWRQALERADKARRGETEADGDA
ncbi:hypothetical protein [Zhihengliuella halotolerans]|uniref:Uncharacterized protein n=1 Tax=Zhihengliuella halotolerans TaxID=370736 RepID=A0A4Q8AGM9_9MICC|nr:hypothetical protein [Zhihengliuella halotolerans]RZU63522.1 hypothetical protein EV380_3143 [Zhihengliuella halotolerans]